MFALAAVVACPSSGQPGSHPGTGCLPGVEQLMKTLVTVGLLAAVSAGLRAQAPRPHIPLDLIGKTIVGHGVITHEIRGTEIVLDSTDYEIAWQITDSGVIRQTLRNLRTGNVESDGTFYRWLFTDNPASYMPDALRYQKQLLSQPHFFPIIQALGRPGIGAVDVLAIGPGWVQSVQVTGAFVSVEYYVRSQ
jgi:hypothetical protein